MGIFEIHLFNLYCCFVKNNNAFLLFVICINFYCLKSLAEFHIERIFCHEDIFFPFDCLLFIEIRVVGNTFRYLDTGYNSLTSAESLTVYS